MIQIFCGYPEFWSHKFPWKEIFMACGCRLCTKEVLLVRKCLLVLVAKLHIFAHLLYTQGVCNHLLLVPIVGGAYFQRHQLTAVLNTSFSVF